MPGITLLGRSLFLACCGFLYTSDNKHAGDVATMHNATTLNDDKGNHTSIEFEYPSWIAPPSNKTQGSISLLTKQSEDDKRRQMASTEFPHNEIILDPDVIILENKTFPETSNILQINIFGNGAPLSMPILKKTQQTVSESLSPNAELTKESPRPRIREGEEDILTVSSFVPISLYAVPKPAKGGVGERPDEIKGQGNVTTIQSNETRTLSEDEVTTENNNEGEEETETPKYDNEVKTEEVMPWWKTSIIYQIYPRSFKDTTASGVGDLAGITAKADYLKHLGIGVVWISPFYVSPMADFGYDVQDFRDIDPIFGTLNDFDVMLKELHKRNIKLIVDFIPNHSSSKHQWFQKSIQKIAPFSDYYVWQNPKGYNETGDPIPPNNWLSVFGGSAWEWSPERKQFYLHQFLKEQPDLNVRNPLVMEELDGILRFWLDRGVDGFRVDALKFLFEAENLNSDEPLSKRAALMDPMEYHYLNQTYSVNRPETVEAVGRWRSILDQYSDRLMVAEVYDDDLREIMKYYGSPSNPLAHFPFNFHLVTELRNRSSVTGLKLKEIVTSWMENVPQSDSWPNWVIGNHDRGRVAARLGRDLVDAINMLLLFLPGTPTSYYGEEIGMDDTFVAFKDAKDPFGLNFGPERYAEFGRDPQRTPMQWDNTTNAGFSYSNWTWLPVNPNFETINVETQEKLENSHLNVYRKMAQLRNQETFRRGDLSFPLVSHDVVAFQRSVKGGPSYLLIINTSSKPVSLDTLEENKENLPDKATLVLRSSTDNRQWPVIGLDVELATLSLIAGEGVILKL